MVITTQNQIDKLEQMWRDVDDLKPELAKFNKSLNNTIIQVATQLDAYEATIVNLTLKGTTASDELTPGKSRCVMAFVREPDAELFKHVVRALMNSYL